MDTEFNSIFSLADELVNAASPFSESERGEQRKLIAEWRVRYGAPCRLAIAGSAKEGKSTLVNALLEHDWAAVGCTETTGTICVMTNKVAPYVAKPVRCVKSDGSGDRWISVAEANAMQGHDREHLERAENVRWLEYALGFRAAPFLADFELVDTPGTGAIVGKDGNSHDKVSLSFVQEVDALVLVAQNTLGSVNKKILSAFHSNRAVNENNPGADVFIIASQVDVGCRTVEEMKNRKALKRQCLLKEAVDNYGFVSSTRVLCVSALLENVILTVGLAGIAELYDRVHASCKVVEDVSDELYDWIVSLLGSNAPIDVIIDAVFISESAMETYNTLRELAGVQELRQYLVEEMRAKKIVFRKGRMLKELLDYYDFTYKNKIKQHAEMQAGEMLAFKRFCSVVEKEPDFQIGQLGRALKAVISGFSQQSLREVEILNANLVDALQQVNKNVQAYWRREEVYSFFRAHADTFTEAESVHIAELCGRDGQDSTPALSELQSRRVYWLSKSRKVLPSERRNFCTNVVSLYNYYIVALAASES